MILFPTVNQQNMILKIHNNFITIVNKTSSISFSPSDANDFSAIKAFLEKINKDIEFKLVVESDKCRLIQFSTGYKLRINKITFFEIANRMILLNKKLISPKINIEESSD